MSTGAGIAVAGIAAAAACIAIFAPAEVSEAVFGISCLGFIYYKILG